MTKFFARLAIVAAVLALAVLVASPVQAGCTSDRTFGTYPPAGGTYFYVSSSGMNTVASMEGFYWVLGEGPTRNSGNYKFDGSGGSQPWFNPGSPFGNGWSLTTTVNNGQTLGCPSPDPTVWVFSDLSADGAGSLFAIVAVDEDLNGRLAYDLGKAGSIALQATPGATVANVSRGSGGGLAVDLTWTSDTAFSTSSTGITRASQVISGWNVYTFEVSRGAPAPSTREISDWTKVGTVAGVSSTGGQITVNCSDSANDVFLAMAPDFDNGFTSTAYVGAGSKRLDCGGAPERRQLKNR